MGEEKGTRDLQGGLDVGYGELHMDAGSSCYCTPIIVNFFLKYALKS